MRHHCILSSVPPLYLFATAPFSAASALAGRTLRSVQAFTTTHEIDTTIILSLTKVEPQKRWRAGVRQLAWLRAETDFRVLRVVDVNRSSFIERVPMGSHGLIRYFDQILRAPLIDRFASIVNLHSSILPWYRGPQPTRWLAARGETAAGYTLHRVTPEIDAGPIVDQETWTLNGVVSPMRLEYESAQRGTAAVLRWLEHVYLGTPHRSRRVEGNPYRAPIGYASRT